MNVQKKKGGYQPILPGCILAWMFHKHITMLLILLNGIINKSNTYIDQCFDDDDDIIVPDPLESLGSKVKLIGV